MMNADQITSTVIGAAIAVHSELGPGLLESAYERCLCLEMTHRGLTFQRQLRVSVLYRGTVIDPGYRLDLLVEGRVIVEVKAISQVSEVHRAQLLSYLRLSGVRLGLLLNFHVKRMADGIQRIVNGWDDPSVNLMEPS